MNKKAFTIIEIVVAMVIMSALAMLTIPPLLDQVRRSKGQEAIHTMYFIRNAMETWGLKNNYQYVIEEDNLFTCGGFDYQCIFNTIEMTNPSHDDENGSTLNSGANFNYHLLTNGGAQDAYSILATDLSTNGSWIREDRDSSGAMTCTTGSNANGGAGIYKGICP